MKRFLLVTLAISTLVSLPALADDERHEHEHEHRYRMDCRFHEKGDDHIACTAHATYIKERHVHGFEHDECEIKHIHYTVTCNGYTLFSNNGEGFSTDDPDSSGEDHIRPLTSNTPEVRILKSGALTHEGTYGDSILDLAEKSLYGSCDVIKKGERH